MLRPLLLTLSVLPAAADDAFDLSLPFAQSSAYNTQTAFLDDVAQINGVKTAMFLHDSEVVFDYARSDTTSSGGLDSLQVQWSVTKSWASFLMGVLIDEGYLANEHVTLEEVFTSPDYDSTWASVTNAAAKKTITVQELLTQTAGYWWCWWEWHANPDSLLQALNFCWDSSTRGSFSYANPSILAYILHELTGETPLEFAASTGAFAALGIAPGDLTWEQNAEGIEMFGYGMYASAAQMAKLGQLYMQHGKSGKTQVVSRAWVARSLSPHVWTGDDWGGDHYGYLWWVLGSTNSARGIDGQRITLFQEDGAVLACTSDNYDAADDLTELVENYFLGGRQCPTPHSTLRPTRRPTSAPAGGSSGGSSDSDEVLDGASIGLLVGVVFLAAAVAGGAFYYRLSKRAVPRPAPVVELATAAFCAQCGAARACGANFCTSCGTPFVDERLPP